MKAFALVYIETGVRANQNDPMGHSKRFPKLDEIQSRTSKLLVEFLKNNMSLVDFL